MPTEITNQNPAERQKDYEVIIMMKHEFEVTWFRFEDGHERDTMISKSRTFDTYDKAKLFLLKRMQVISCIYWAGGMVEDEMGNIILDITSDGDITEKRNIKGRIL